MQRGQKFKKTATIKNKILEEPDPAYKLGKNCTIEKAKIVHFYLKVIEHE